MLSSLRNLFGPPQHQDQKIPPPSGDVSPPNKTPRPRVLPISPLACTDSLSRSRSKLASLPSSPVLAAQLQLPKNKKEGGIHQSVPHLLIRFLFPQKQDLMKQKLNLKDMIDLS